MPAEQGTLTTPALLCAPWHRRVRVCVCVCAWCTRGRQVETHFPELNASRPHYVPELKASLEGSLSFRWSGTEVVLDPASVLSRDEVHQLAGDLVIPRTHGPALTVPLKASGGDGRVQWPRNGTGWNLCSEYMLGHRTISAKIEWRGKSIVVELSPRAWTIVPRVGQRTRLLSGEWGCATVVAVERDSGEFISRVDNSDAHFKLSLLAMESSRKQRQEDELQGPLRAPPWILKAESIFGPNTVPSEHATAGDADASVNLESDADDAKHVNLFPERWEHGEGDAAGQVLLELSVPPHPYETGQHLLVVYDGGLRDAKVVAWVGTADRPTCHSLCVQEYEPSLINLDLNPFNHSIQRFPSVAAYEKARRAFCKLTCVENEMVEDGITGVRMRVEDQVLRLHTSAYSGMVRPGWSDVSDVKGLGPALWQAWPSLEAHGVHPVQPVLVEAGAGTGKTWSAIQLVRELASTTETAHIVKPTPAIVYVQRVARMINDSPVDCALSLITLLQYQERELTTKNLEALDLGASVEDLMDAFAQALELRALVIILDGIDEAAGRRASVSQLLRLDIAQHGLRVVATSRPYGVHREKFGDTFAIIQLEPLSNEQIRMAMLRQLQNHSAALEFTQHLLAVLNTRTQHDELYHEIITSVERWKIESMPDTNIFVLEDPPADVHRDSDGSAYDPNMRQPNIQGKRPIACNNGVLRCKYIRLLDDGIRPWLTKIDDTLSGLPVGATEVQIAEAVEEAVASVAPDDTSTLKSAHLLALLTVKRGVSSVALWPIVTARTDELFEVAEVAQPLFAHALCSLLAKVGIPQNRIADVLQLGSLKHPVRVHEKACDDYGSRFPDGLPESAVGDVLRARIICPDTNSMIQIQELLKEGLEAQADDGTIVRLSLARAKAKFKHADLDPTHFRNVLNNICISFSGTFFIGEVQIHHAKILEFNEASHAHDHYNYFRAALRDAYSSELNALMERTLDFLGEVNGVPVLLSMLIVCLMTQDFTQGVELPSTRLELYERAIKGLLQKRSADGMRHISTLACISSANMLNQRRVFTTNDATVALARAKLAGNWDQLSAGYDDLPLIKTLEEGSAEVLNSVYQFRHLSFQEGLFALQVFESADVARTLVRRNKSLAGVVNDVFFANCCQIGGHKLGQQLANICKSTTKLQGVMTVRTFPGSRRTKRQVLLSAEGVQTLSYILPGLKQRLLHLDFSKVGLDDSHLQALANGLKDNGQLLSLELSYNRFGAVQVARVLLPLLTCGLESLTWLNVDGGLGLPILELRGQPQHACLDLSRRGLSTMSAVIIAGLLRKNKFVKELDLQDNLFDQADYQLINLSVSCTIASQAVQPTDGPMRSLHYLPQVVPFALISQLLEAFQVFDTDGGGSIDAADLKDLMKSLGQDCTDLELSNMIRIADADGTGVHISISLQASAAPV